MSEVNHEEAGLSAKQRDILKREDTILAAAEKILINDGFLDMSMARVAQKSKCPRGTIYLHFVSREDILVALACRAWERRLTLLERGASYPGPTRIRMSGVLVGSTLFSQLYPAHFSIMYKATQTVCERASLHRIERLRSAERATGDIVRRLIDEAVRAGDLKVKEVTTEKILFAYSAMTTGGFALNETGVSVAALDLADCMGKLRWSLNLLGDAFGWRPLSREVDWDRVEEDIRQTMFPEEVLRVSEIQE